MDRSLILALDIGTSSVRAALYDTSAQPLARSHSRLDRLLTSTQDGGSEIDADTAVEQVASVIDNLMERTAHSKRPITHSATSTFWHSLVGVDEKGRPTTPVFSWADTRSRKYTDALRKRCDEQAVHNRTGARFHSSFWPAKLLWLRRERPESWSKTARWMSLGDYVAAELFGASASSLSMASGTGMFDIRQCVWDSELLKYLQVKRTSVPDLAADKQTFKLKSKFSKRWPRLAETEWLPAVADGVGDNVGAACSLENRAALMIGTSGAMRVLYKGDPPANIPGGLWCYRVDEKRVILGGALSDGGGLYRWLSDTLKLPKDAEQQIAGRSPGAGGFAFMPFIAGERSTGYRETARGAIFGLRSDTSAVDFLQSAFESVAYRFAEIFDQLKTVVPLTEIVASGGALRDSPVWAQIISDVLGRDLVLNSADESSSRGAVLLALESIGKIDDIAISPPGPSKVVVHRPANHAAYRPERARHEEIYQALSKLNQ